MHEWITECGHTPHVVIDTEADGVLVPMEHARDGRIVLNVAYRATDRPTPFVLPRPPATCRFFDTYTPSIYVRSRWKHPRLLEYTPVTYRILLIQYVIPGDRVVVLAGKDPNRGDYPGRNG